MGIYERIQELCKEHGISIRKLERELGFGNSTIAKWKTSEPAFASIRAVAEYFHVSIGYLIGQETEKNSNKSDKSIIEKIDIFSSVGGSKKGISPNTVCIQLADEPDIHICSKYAYELAKMMKDMPEEDLEFLANTAERISPKPKKQKKVIVVENPANKKETNETDINNVVPFPQYPSVTNKDIDEFAARNAKKKFTREEIAEMLYIMKEED